MRLGGLQKTTLVDYPGKVAATVFTQGCVFRCPYCHNPELVLPEQFSTALPLADFFDFLEKRQGKLEAVCITGGEPTIHPDLPDFIARIKSLGYLVKLDSNGTNPKALERLFASGTIDYLAMDIKGPEEKYAAVSGAPASLLAAVRTSIRLIMDSGIPYEFRTTVAKPLLATEDFFGIGRLIEGARLYYVQNYVRSKQVSRDEFFSFSDEEMEAARAIMQPFVEMALIR